MKPLRLVLLATPRSGSRLVSSLLGSHPDVRLWDEPFNKGHVPRACMPAHPTITHAEIVGMGKAYYDWFWGQPCARKVLGFSHHLWSLGWQPLRWVLEDKQAFKVIVRRRNLLAQYVSLQEAHQTNQWSLRDVAKRKAPEPVTLDAALFAAWVDKTNKGWETVAKRTKGHRVRTVWYESVSSFRLGGLLDALDLPRVPLTTAFHKQAAGPLEARVANWKDFTKALKKDHEGFVAMPDAPEVT